MTAFSVPANLAFDNYQDLYDAIADWMDRGDLTGSVQSMVALAEARMRRELAPYMTEVSAPVDVVEGYGTLPDDFGTISRVYYGDRTLPQLPLTALMPTGAQPKGFTVEAGGIRVWPSCVCTLTVLYQPFLVQLSEADPTNVLLDQHPDLYFYGAMMFAEGYVANDSRASLFKSLWDEALQSAREYFLRQKFAMPLAPRVAWLP